MTGDDQVWDVFADRSRRAIVTALAEQPRAVGELAESLPISRPAVSQHLRVLKDAGVVADEEHGTRRVYRVDRAALRVAHASLDVFWDAVLAEPEPAPDPEPVAAKVKKAKKHKKKAKH